MQDKNSRKGYTIRIRVNLQEIKFARKYKVLELAKKNCREKELAKNVGKWNLQGMDFARNAYAYSLNGLYVVS